MDVQWENIEKNMAEYRETDGKENCSCPFL